MSASAVYVLDLKGKLMLSEKPGSLLRPGPRGWAKHTGKHR